MKRQEEDDKKLLIIQKKRNINDICDGEKKKQTKEMNHLVK